MLTVSTFNGRNCLIVPTAPIVAANNASKVVLTSIVNDTVDYAFRGIQNVGANACYYAFGTDNCDPTNFNGILAKGTAAADANGFTSGDKLDCSICPQQLSVWSVGGTTLAITLIKRDDNARGQGNILTANPE